MSNGQAAGTPTLHERTSQGCETILASIYRKKNILSFYILDLFCLANLHAEFHRNLYFYLNFEYEKLNQLKYTDEVLVYTYHTSIT